MDNNNIPDPHSQSLNHGPAQSTTQNAYTMEKDEPYYQSVSNTAQVPRNQYTSPVSTSQMHSSNHQRHITLPTWLFVILLIAALIVGAVPGTIVAINESHTNLVLTSQYENLATHIKQDKQKSGSQSQKVNKSTTSDNSNNDSTSSTRAGKIGDTLTSGSISMKLENVDYPTSITTKGDDVDDPGNLTPKPGNKFVAMHTTVTNNGQRSVDFSCDFVINIEALNDKGQQYDEIDKEYDINGNPECDPGLQPGMNEKMTFVFEVPSNTKIVGAAWQDETNQNKEGPVVAFRF